MNWESIHGYVGAAVGRQVAIRVGLFLIDGVLGGSTIVVWVVVGEGVRVSVTMMVLGIV